MNTLNRTTRTIAVALIGLTSLAVLAGCTGGLAPVAAPKQAAAPASQGAVVLATAFNPTTSLFYTANGAGNTVSVFSGVTNTLVATVNVGQNPVGIAVNPVTNVIYVVNSLGTGSMSVIDGATNTVKATLTTVGDDPYSVVVNPVTNKVYVANWVTGYDHNLYVVDGVTNKVTSSLTVGDDVSALAINTKTNTIYATTMYTVAVIDGSKDTVTATLAPSTPYRIASGGIAVDESTNTVYVANTAFGPWTITAINGATNQVITTVDLGANGGSLSVNPQTHMVYVGITGAKALVVFSGITNTVTGQIALKYEAEDVTVNPSANMIYVAEASEVAIVNVAAGTTLDMPVQ
jgi:YVTN family beta-propeller protein